MTMLSTGSRKTRRKHPRFRSVLCLILVVGVGLEGLASSTEPQAGRFLRSARIVALSSRCAAFEGAACPGQQSARFAENAPLAVLYRAPAPFAGQRLPEEQQKQKPPVFKSETYAGLLEIRVQRPDGSLVWNLSREDFQVKDRGQVRSIVLFEPPREVPISSAILVDVGMAVDAKTVSDSRELVFQLVHLLDPSDEIMLGIFTDRVPDTKRQEGANGQQIPGTPKQKVDVEFLTDLTSDRKELIENLWNISPTGRRSRWSQLGEIAAGGFQLGNESRTGLAVDEALLKLKRAKHTNKVILLLSSSFGNIGPGTLDHLELAGARLFAVVNGGTGFAEMINLGGNKKSGVDVVESSGGLTFTAARVKSQLQELRDALKKYYLLAYEADAQTAGDAEITVKGHPEYTVHQAPRTSSSNSFY